MTSNQAVAVYGAYGHTGRFILAELRARGLTAIASGRDAEQLRALAGAHPGVIIRPAAIDDAAALDRAFDGAAAVINCAGPFAVTAAPVIEAALRVRVPYVDVAAEVEIVDATFARYDERARAAGIPLLPAMAFYGGLGDLLATIALDGWATADELALAYALSSWRPTRGTRAAGVASKQRRGGRRLVLVDRRLELRSDSAPVMDWTFPAPVGSQQVVAEFVTADCVTISRHLDTRVLNTYMTAAPLRDLADPDLSPPAGVDARGRSAQTFLVEVVARRAGEERRVVARGQDIYAISGSFIGEAARRIVDGAVSVTGAITAGTAFDARDFLRALPIELEDRAR